MNQRIKRSSRKNDQDITFSSMHTGGHISQHSREAEPKVRVPQKTTGDVKDEKLSGLAKASPLFQKPKEILKPKTKKDEEKVLAKNTVEDKKKDVDKEVND